jgi:hypothetical protein
VPDGFFRWKIQVIKTLHCCPFKNKTKPSGLGLLKEEMSSLKGINIRERPIRENILEELILEGCDLGLQLHILLLDLDHVLDLLVLVLMAWPIFNY